jgi:hypothetical protein
MRRRRARGTAMVELAIVAPLLVLVWASINHFRNSYLMAQQVLHESRMQAWAYATSGKCSHSVVSQSPLLLEDFGSFGTEAIGSFELLPGHGSILNGTATIDAKVGRAAPASTPGLSFLAPSGQVGGRTFLHCNDELPTPDNTVLPQMLPMALKELGVQP